MSGKKRRSDYRIALRPQDDGMLDDTVVKDVTMFRAEMMDRNTLWMCCYLDDTTANRITFWVRSTRQGLKVGVTELPDDVPGITYENDDDVTTVLDWRG